MADLLVGRFIGFYSTLIKCVIIIEYILQYMPQYTSLQCNKRGRRYIQFLLSLSSPTCSSCVCSHSSTANDEAVSVAITFNLGRF